MLEFPAVDGLAQGELLRKAFPVSARDGKRADQGTLAPVLALQALSRVGGGDSGAAWQGTCPSAMNSWGASVGDSPRRMRAAPVLAMRNGQPPEDDNTMKQGAYRHALRLDRSDGPDERHERERLDLRL